MEIVRIRRNGPSLGYVVERLVSTAGHLDGLTEVLGLGHGLLGPYTRIQVGSLLLQEVEGHHAEFQTGTAAQEEYAVAFGNVEELLEESHCLIYDRLEVLGAVTHLHERETASLEINACCTHSLHHLFGQLGGAGVEIVLFHCCSFLFKLLVLDDVPSSWLFISLRSYRHFQMVLRMAIFLRNAKVGCKITTISCTLQEKCHLITL